MDIDKFQLFLDRVDQVARHYEKLAKSTGENFNIFKTLNLESSEVRLHSSILAEFLNPQGLHGQGDLFLRLFIKQLGIKDFNSEFAIAEAEKDVGPINEARTIGGRIDILITDNKKSIAIENKIYAYDQENQLYRYHNSIENPVLFYLTLNGSSPSDLSKGDLDKDKYTNISYKKDIISWLENCKKEAATLPIIRETIVQYINLLKSLTHQTSKEKMNEEIRNFILENPKYIDSIELCSEVLNEVTNDTKTRFLKELKEQLPNNTLVFSDNEISIVVHAEEDHGSIYIGYKLSKNHKNNMDSPNIRRFSETLKGIRPDAIKSSTNHIGWYTPEPFKQNEKLEIYDKKNNLILSKDNQEIYKIIDSIIIEEKKIRTEFQKRIKEF